jgi:hypothetical protein
MRHAEANAAVRCEGNAVSRQPGDQSMMLRTLPLLISADMRMSVSKILFAPISKAISVCACREFEVCRTRT